VSQVDGLSSRRAVLHEHGYLQAMPSDPKPMLKSKDCFQMKKTQRAPTNAVSVHAYSGTQLERCESRHRC
jgi:hypothetical protein